MWLKDEQIDAKLAEMGTDYKNRAALKCHLKFRQKSFEYVQVMTGSFFSFQKFLTDNLKNLLQKLRNDKTVIRSSLKSNV